MSGARILVVDDEELIRWSLVERMRAESIGVGYRTSLYCSVSRSGAPPEEGTRHKSADIASSAKCT